MIDYTTPLFKSSRVAQACGIGASSFRMHFVRGHFRVIGLNAKMADSAGMPNLFSLRDVVGFAIASRLMGVSKIDPKRAFEIAMMFAHTGSEARFPGAAYNIYQNGETLLLYYPDIDKARLITENEMRSLYQLRVGGDAGAVIVVPLNRFLEAVFNALGLDGRVALLGTPDGGSAAESEVGEFIG